MYGRQLMVFDCDAFTRQWLKEHLQLDEAALAPLPVSNSWLSLQWRQLFDAIAASVCTFRLHTDDACPMQVPAEETQVCHRELPKDALGDTSQHARIQICRTSTRTAGLLWEKPSSILDVRGL